MKIEDLICKCDKSVDMDEYFKFRKKIKEGMPYPEWLRNRTNEEIISLLENNSKLWVYYLNDEIVCSMMLIPADKELLEKYGLNSNDTISYGSMIVNPKYRGNGLQYQMLKVLDKCSKDLGYTLAIGTVHPDNIYSTNNIIKDKFVYIERRILKSGIRDVYLKLL